MPNMVSQRAVKSILTLEVFGVITVTALQKVKAVIVKQN